MILREGKATNFQLVPTMFQLRCDRNDHLTTCRCCRDCLNKCNADTIDLVSSENLDMQFAFPFGGILKNVVTVVISQISVYTALCTLMRHKISMCFLFNTFPCSEVLHLMECRHGIF